MRVLIEGIAEFTSDTQSAAEVVTKYVQPAVCGIEYSIPAYHIRLIMVFFGILFKLCYNGFIIK